MSSEGEGPSDPVRPRPHGAGGGSGGGRRPVAGAQAGGGGVACRLGQPSLSVSAGALTGTTGVSLPSCGGQGLLLSQHHPPRPPLPQ